MLRPGQRGDLVHAGEFAGRQPAHHGDRGPLDEPAGLGPVFLGGQRVQVGQGVGDHHVDMPLARFSRVRLSAYSTRPGAPRSARHSSSITPM